MGRANKNTPVQETPVEENEMIETPVEETVEETVQETPVEAEPVTVYKFKSVNPYLTVATLGIQFRKGYAETTNLNIARALAKVGGVELVED